ncbi:MAG: helix-turn-helix transcriptional regulator [Candidatus Wallacebacter cryptica]
MAREKLICARLNKQLTQEDVASFAGISRSHYALIESGKRTPFNAEKGCFPS